jgi:coenzyme F420-reducing hydrogenase beta subunit
VVRDGKVRPEFFIARDKRALLSAQGSKYMAVDFVQDALPLIRSFEGHLAVTLLPCDTSSLRRAMEKDSSLASKIFLVITLFCGHNSLPELTDMVVDKLAPEGARLSEFRHRQGHWRGSLQAQFDDGRSVEKPFSYFSDYQNLYFFCQQKCHHCHDHTGYDGDISIGDIWSLRMKNDPIKHSAVVTRTTRGAEVFTEALNKGILAATEEPIEEICEGQARSMPFHYNVSARARAGKLLGFKIKDSVHARVRWNDFLVAWLALFNEKLSRSTGGRKIIAHLPRFALKSLLYLMKGLESL